jgi:hemerythrin
MSAIADFNLAANDGTDREHQVQLELLQRLCEATSTSTDAATVKSLLEQLIDYSEAHFMSEELLMRMKSYDDYAAHQDDHNRMLEVLRGIANNSTDQSALLAGKAREMLNFISGHIATRDKRLADYVRQGL